MKKLINLKDKYLGHFKVNLGESDRMIRVCLGSLILILSVMLLSDFYQVVGLLVAISLIFNGLVGFCGIYNLLGISTCKIQNKRKR